MFFEKIKSFGLHWCSWNQLHSSLSLSPQNVSDDLFFVCFYLGFAGACLLTVHLSFDKQCFISVFIHFHSAEPEIKIYLYFLLLSETLNHIFEIILCAVYLPISIWLLLRHLPVNPSLLSEFFIQELETSISAS